MNTENYKFPIWIKAATSIIVLFIIVFGAIFFHVQKQIMRHQVEKRLASVARLKVDQIADWRRDRLNEGAEIANRPHLIERITRWLADPRDDNHEILLSEFLILQQQENYLNVLLVDTTGEVRLGLPGPSEFSSEYKPALLTAFRNRKPVLTELHSDDQIRKPHLFAVTPLFSGQEPYQPVGAVILMIDPALFLYPLIQSWPVDSESAETLLVRREGNDVLFLNTLRHQSDTALNLRIPLSQVDLPAAMAVKGRQGVAIGRDYRGVEVMSVLLPVPDSPWFTVTKIDADEAFAPWRSRAILILVLFVCKLGLVGGLALFARQYELKKHYLALYRSEQRHSITLKSIGDAVIVTDAQGRVEMLNPIAETLTGWPHEQARGRPLDEVFHIINEYTLALVESPVARVMREDTVVGLANHTLLIDRNGAQRPIADSGAPIRNAQGDVTGVVLVFRDQSEEQAYQRKILESEQQHRLALEAASLGTWRHDFASDTVRLDERGQHCYGIDKKTVALSEIMERVHADDVERLGHEISSVMDPKSGLESFETEYRVIHPDGSLCWVSVVVRVEFCGTGAERKPAYSYGTVQDITGKKKSQEALRQSLERYEELVQNANSAIIRWRNDGAVTFFNEYAQSFFGYSPEEIIGKHIGVLVPRQDSSGNDPSGLVQNILADPERYVSSINENVCRDGRRVWMSWTNKAIRDEEGHLKEILTVGSDITELKEAEDALRDSESFHRQVLESIPGMVFTTRPDGYCDYQSQQWVDYTGVPMSEHLGDGWNQLLHPEDRPRAFAAWRSAVEENAPYDLEYRVRRHDGVYEWFRVIGRKIHDSEGRVVRWFGVAMNIEALKQAEETLFISEKKLAEELRAANCLQQVSTKLIQAAEETETLYDKILDTAMAILKSDFASIQVYHPERGTDGQLRLLGHRGFNGQATKFWKWVTPTSNSTCGMSLRNRKRVIVSDIQKCDAMAGSEDLETCIQNGIRAVQTTPLISRSGNILGMLSTHWRNPHTPAANELRSLDVLARQAADLIDRIRAEQALRNLNETLEQQVAERTKLAEARSKQLQSLAVELIEAEERERRRVAYLLHDDLQQVLAAARFQLQSAVQSRCDAPELATVTKLLEDSISKSRRLSHDLSPPVLLHYGLVEALQWLCRQMHEQFELQVQLETKYQEPVSPPLKRFLFRAVQELLFNIVKHAGEKNARVTLLNQDGFLAVTVTDDGRGFDPGILDHPKESKGFGLLTIRERASYIGGNLFIESVPGEGSRFTLQIPLVVTKSESAKELASPADRKPQISPTSYDPIGVTGKRVLFADDHQVMRQGLIRLIAGQPGIHVIGEAANGREAVEKSIQLRPDVIVMDISMPEMDGIEATRRIKAELPQVRVIGLSMHEEEHISRAMREAGAESFVSKTASPAELLKAIYGST